MRLVVAWDVARDSTQPYFVHIPADSLWRRRVINEATGIPQTPPHVCESLPQSLHPAHSVHRVNSVRTHVVRVDCG